MPLIYRDAVLGAAEQPDPSLVRVLQKDLRELGYLKRNIDGQFGGGTRLAVQRLQFDLLHNHGESSSGDGAAPVRMIDYNRGVTAVTGMVDTALANSIEALLDEPLVPRLPQSADPKSANASAIALVSGTASTVAPPPYLLAMFLQESGGEHFAQPRASGDIDSFLTIGLDTNAASVEQVTSRGYGLGQYTLFHHPPTQAEVADFMLDPLRNAQKAFAELRDKFNHFLVGSSSATRADDRDAEHPLLALRLCRYGPGDPRYLSACQACASQTQKIDITSATPLYHLSSQTYGEATNYPNPTYAGVPDRADFQCDWPYALRRFNGIGPNSFNYQAKVLTNLLVHPTGMTGGVT